MNAEDVPNRVVDRRDLLWCVSGFQTFFSAESCVFQLSGGAAMPVNALPAL